MKYRWMLGVLCASATGAATATNLVEVYDRSTNTDPQWQQAIYTYRAATETKTQALLNLLPVALNVDKNWGSTGGESNNTPVYAALNLSVNLFSWNSWIALKAADATVAQAEANHQAAAQSLISRVATQYFAVLQAQDTLTAQQSALASVQSQLDQAERRFQVGLIAVTDVEVARASRDSTNAQVIADKRALATQEDLLRAITGENYNVLAAPGDDMPLLTPDPASEDRWVTTAMNQNSNLIASRMAADISRDAVLTAYGGHLPTVDVTVSKNWLLQHKNSAEASNVLSAQSSAVTGGVGGQVDTNLDWEIGISVPIFAGGATQSKVRQARYTWEASKSALDYTTRQTEEQTRDAYQGVISQIAQVQALKQAVESNQVSLQAIEAGYEVGTKTAVDVLTQRAALVAAETSYAQAKYSYLDDIVALRLAAGNLDRKTVELINGWLAEPRPANPAVPATPDSPTTTPAAPLDSAPVTPPTGAAPAPNSPNP